MRGLDVPRIRPGEKGACQITRGKVQMVSHQKLVVELASSTQPFLIQGRSLLKKRCPGGQGATDHVNGLTYEGPRPGRPRKVPKYEGKIGDPKRGSKGAPLRTEHLLGMLRSLGGTGPESGFVHVQWGRGKEH